MNRMMPGSDPESSLGSFEIFIPSSFRKYELMYLLYRVFRFIVLFLFWFWSERSMSDPLHSISYLGNIWYPSFPFVALHLFFISCLLHFLYFCNFCIISNFPFHSLIIGLCSRSSIDFWAPCSLLITQGSGSSVSMTYDIIYKIGIVPWRPFDGSIRELKRTQVLFLLLKINVAERMDNGDDRLRSPHPPITVRRLIVMLCSVYIIKLCCGLQPNLPFSR
jgi:hypothetical protein